MFNINMSRKFVKPPKEHVSDEESVTSENEFRELIEEGFDLAYKKSADKFVRKSKQRQLKQKRESSMLTTFLSNRKFSKVSRHHSLLDSKINKEIKTDMAYKHKPHSLYANQSAEQ
jgi:hypothetical protein